MAIYSIWEGHLEELRARAGKIIAKCEKYGCEYRYEELDTDTYKTVEVDGEVEILRYVDVLLEGYAVAGDWAVIASIEHTENGNIVKSYYWEELPAKYLNSAPTCDHCNTRRARKNTFVVENQETHEMRQVGRTCLEDYTGIPLELAANVEKLYAEIDECTSRRPSGISDRYFESAKVLAYAFHVAKNGYIAKGKDGATVDQVKKFYYTRRDETTREDFEMAEKAMAWISQVDPEGNEFLNNVKTVAGLTYIACRHIGYLVGLIPTYQRAQRDLERAKNSSSKWVGEEGKRITVAVQNGIKCVAEWESCYSAYSSVTTRLFTFTDTEGNIYTWKTSKWLDEEDGDWNVKQITGTVKSHSDYKGIKQTELTRCKVSY